MSTAATTPAPLGAGSTMLVVDPADLRRIIGEMYLDAVAEATAALEAARETPAMSRREVMAALKVSYTTLYNWEKSGYIHPVRVGSRVLYRRAEVEAIMHGHPSKQATVANTNAMA